MTDLDLWPTGAHITSSDPAYDGWCIDVYVVHRAVDGATEAAFLAFHCVDAQGQGEVIEKVINSGWTGLKDCCPSDDQATQLVELFRSKPGAKFIEGWLEPNDDGTIGFLPTRWATVEQFRKRNDGT
jgi:hypothetical protein